jgi:hypothetical protein
MPCSKYYLDFLLILGISASRDPNPFLAKIAKEIHATAKKN